MRRQVRVRSLYRYDPVPLDRFAVHLQGVEVGRVVRVVTVRGCPPANTMGNCYVEDAKTNEFIGMVCTNSLQPVGMR